MTYTEIFNDTEKHDELFAGPEQNVRLINVNVESGTTLSRGELLAAESFQDKFKPVTAADTEKVLLVNAYETSSSATVTSAYMSGIFNRKKIILADGVELSDFESELRKQNIFIS